MNGEKDYKRRTLCIIIKKRNIKPKFSGIQFKR